jgi:hypothetical protein
LFIELFFYNSVRSLTILENLKDLGHSNYLHTPINEMTSEQEIMILSCTAILGMIAIIVCIHCMKLFCANPVQYDEEQSDDDPQSIQVVVKSSPLQMIRVYREEDPVAPV